MEQDLKNIVPKNTEIEALHSQISRIVEVCTRTYLVFPSHLCFCFFAHCFRLSLFCFICVSVFFSILDATREKQKFPFYYKYIRLSKFSFFGGRTRQTLNRHNHHLIIYLHLQLAWNLYSNIVFLYFYLYNAGGINIMASLQNRKI